MACDMSPVTCTLALPFSLRQDRDQIIVFNRTNTIYVVFHSCGCYDVPWVLITDARSFQALATILDYM